MTVIFLVSVLPPYPAVSTLITIFPSPPGGICLGYETAVHPQPVLTFSITSGASPLFCMIKSCVTSVPSITVGNVYRLSGTKTDGDGGVCCEAPNAPLFKNKIQTTAKKMDKSLSFILKISLKKINRFKLTQTSDSRPQPPPSRQGMNSLFKVHSIECQGASFYIIKIGSTSRTTLTSGRLIIALFSSHKL